MVILISLHIKNITSLNFNHFVVSSKLFFSFSSQIMNALHDIFVCTVHFCFLPNIIGCNHKLKYIIKLFKKCNEIFWKHYIYSLLAFLYFRASMSRRVRLRAKHGNHHPNI